jgi:transcriptional regulator with XRE-family HTH domain
MSHLIGAKLKHLIARANLTPSQFTADLAEFLGVRRPVVEAWLQDERSAYGSNLKKLARFWQGYFPDIAPSHFLMEDDDFVKALASPRESRSGSEGGIVLPIQMNPLTGAQLNALTGSYRLYRYALTARPALICEAVSIFPSSNATLGVELRSPLAKGVQRFAGTVIAMGDRTYLLLSDVDTSSSAMRFITFHGRFDRKSKHHLIGIMSGAFDRDDTLSSVTVALEKQSGDPKLALEEASWLSLDALDRVSREILLDLTQTKLPGTT